MTSSAEPLDAVVVGAGFAGLVAARELARTGRSVVVLEARNRVGGRTKSGQIAGLTIDLGGMWVGPGQDRLLALADAHGVERYLSPITGRNVTEIGDEIREGEGDMPALDDAAMGDLERIMGELDALTATVRPEAPWHTPDAARLDALTFAVWAQQATQHEQARAMLDALLAGLLSSDPASVSMLYFLFHLRSAGGLEAVMSIGEGAQKWLHHGGVHQIAERIAAELGERVVLDAPVERIERSEDGVVVTSAAGAWTAAYAIVAVPPALCARIRFSPPLPAMREKLVQRYPMGSVVKFWVAYDTPFWRELGRSGYTFSDRSPIGMAFDATPDGAPVGLFAGFFEGAAAVEWGPRGRDARRELVVDELTRLYGPRAAEPLDYVDQDWTATEWSRGGYSGIATPGTLSLFGPALREPVGRILWAGAETSPEYPGYIEGAIRSGERAAASVDERLR